MNDMFLEEVYFRPPLLLAEKAEPRSDNRKCVCVDCVRWLAVNRKTKQLSLRRKQKETDTLWLVQAISIAR